jgi:biotin carboxylase
MHLFLNQGFSEVYHAIIAIKQGLGDAIRVTASHSDEGSLYRAAADDFVTEPRGLRGSDYGAWFHRQAGELGATLVWPQRRVADVLEAAESLPTDKRLPTIAAGDPATLRLLGDKVRTYQACAGSEIPVPAFRVANTPEELADALDELRAAGESPCVKPAVSTFGHGFRQVLPESDPFRRLLANDTFFVGRDELIGLYAGAAARVPMLVMPYLEGPEYSIDCLALGGVLLRHVARRKSGEARGQLLTTSPELARIAEAATARFALNAVFNVQLRQHRGTLYLLEINPRMSGGLAVAGASGLSFPEWAVRLAAGAAPAEVPMPRYGALVAQLDTPILLAPAVA